MGRSEEQAHQGGADRGGSKRFGELSRADAPAARAPPDGEVDVDEWSHMDGATNQPDPECGQVAWLDGCVG